MSQVSMPTWFEAAADPGWYEGSLRVWSHRRGSTRRPTPDITAVAAMADAMVDRGPDGAGVWSAGRVALGHRRLKIIDLSEAGSQPMVDPELGLAICWNGCIYNYPQLRDELIGHGYRFFSHSDTEVLLKAYHRWGDRFVDRLHGHVRLRDRRTRQRPGAAGPRPARDQAAVPDRGRRPRPVRVLAARAAGRRRRRHPHRPDRAAPLPDASTRWCRRRSRSCAASPRCRRPR